MNGEAQTVQRRAMNALRIYLENYEIKRDPRAAAIAAKVAGGESATAAALR